MQKRFTMKCCNKSMTFEIGQRKSSKRTCSKCRREWVVDSTGRATSDKLNRQEWEGTSCTGTQSFAGLAKALDMCGEKGKFVAACHTHSQCVSTNSWSRAKKAAKQTDSWCSVCCGDIDAAVYDGVDAKMKYEGTIR
jgi:hypothetical protein